ncbi:hypothetical protein Tco_0763345 [Tanacetum coccineum]
METQKPLLKDKNGEEVDVHMYRYQIDIMEVQWYQSVVAIPQIDDISMWTILQLPQVVKCFGMQNIYLIIGQVKKSVRLMMEKLIGMEFELMLAYVTTVGLLLLGCSCIEQFWSSAVAKTINEEVQLHALVDGKRIVITETFVRRTLRLEDAKVQTTAWNEFSSTMASAIICLATNQKFNFSKLIFDSMVRNLDNLSGKFLMYPRELTRLDTEIPQSSGPTEHVADKAVHKERGDSFVRAATTASSLEAEQDSGNITKTRSKATLNEPSFPRTSSGSGPRCQETMGDTIAQTRFENKTKTTQAEEIVSLKRRVKKLEQKKRSTTHKLKRLRKVGATTRVESSDDESLGKDESKHRRIDVIDADDDITLVSVHDVNVSAGEEEAVEVINTAKLIIDVAQVSAAGDKVSTAGAATTVSVATTTTTTIVDEITLAQALQELKSTKPKVKGIIFIEPEEPVKKLSKKDQLKLDEEIARKLQAAIDEEERITSSEEEKIDEAYRKRRRGGGGECIFP